MSESPATRSVEEHLARILAGVAPLAVTTLPLDECDGLVVAEDVVAQVDVPSFDNSSMDGYAVIADDLAAAGPATPVVLEVVADIAAGSDAEPTLVAGTAARIMTGAPMPGSADAVVPVEGTDGGMDRVVVTEAHRAGAFVRRVGGDVRRGDIVAAAGTVLTPRHLAAIAATGGGDLTVIPAPRVAVISTGSELVGVGARLRRGMIHDSNGVFLAHALANAGCVVAAVGRVRDDEDALHRTVADFAPIADLIVLSGGASVGAYDVVKALLQRHGSVRFDSVRMQPGKPQGFGHWVDGTPVFALPGNPVSVFVSFEVMVRPALDRMRGLALPHRDAVLGTASEGWRTPPGRRQYIPVRVERTFARGFEEFTIRPVTSAGSASHLVASLAGADALAVVDELVDRVDEGDRLPLLPIPGGAPLRTID